MPLKDANEQISDTSTEIDQDDTLDIIGEGAEGEGGNGASSSDAQDGTEGQRETIDVVRDVVGERKPEAGSSPEGQKEGAEADPKAAQAAKEPDNENYSDVPFHKHPRFQTLLREKKSFETDATRYRNVQGFLNKSGVSADEAAGALEIVALTKTDPEKAWAAIKPIVQDLLVKIGEVLPEDLKSRVASGELTQEAAQEISRHRGKAATVEQGRTFEQQQREKADKEAHAKSITDAADAWEADKSAKDPNFAAKRESLFKELNWIFVQEGKADTPEKVRDQLNRAFQKVAGVIAPRINVPTPTVGQARQSQRRPAASASQNPKPAAERTTADIIAEVVGKRGQG